MTSPKEAIRKISAWIEKNTLSDATFYSQVEWRRRGEKLGNNAIFTMTAEGRLNHALNYLETSEDLRLVRDFYKLAKRLGYFIEQGFSWSWHFYPAKPTSIMSVNPRWSAIARKANEIGRLSRKKGAPKLTALSDREALLHWMSWNDPNSFWEEYPDLSLEELWDGMAKYVSE